MKTKTFRSWINWIMLISLIVVFISGILLKPFPGMWMGISHGISSYIVAICVVIHCVQNRMIRIPKKEQ